MHIRPSVKTRGRHPRVFTDRYTIVGDVSLTGAVVCDRIPVCLVCPRTHQGSDITCSMCPMSSGVLIRENSSAGASRRLFSPTSTTAPRSAHACFTEFQSGSCGASKTSDCATPVVLRGSLYGAGRFGSMDANLSLSDRRTPQKISLGTRNGGHT